MHAVVRWRVGACALLACLMVYASPIMRAHAQAQATPLQADGRPVQPAHDLRDREFGVATRYFGLQRQVEMYQWQRQGDDYIGIWNAEPIDSTGHDSAHANPGRFPVQPRYWIAEGLVLDGKPIDEEVLKQLGHWRPFRPNFSRLPANLAATFQPEGDGLGSADDPLAPNIGDLRITWRQLVLPDLAGALELRDGRWVPKPASTRKPAGTVDSWQPGVNGAWSPLAVPIGIGIALSALVLAVLLPIRRLIRKRRR